MKEKTIRLPLRIIKDILRNIPPRELAVLQKDSLRGAVKSAPATNLLKLDGIVAVGGDALEDTEKIWG
jgi:hypothetical protein